MFVNFAREFYYWDKFSKIALFLGIFLFVTGYAWFLGIALIMYSIFRSKSIKLNGRNNKNFDYKNIKGSLNNIMNNIKKHSKLNDIVNNMKFNDIINNMKLNNIKKNIESINTKIKKYSPMESLKERRKYIITSCPKCSQKLRLPKGKGKIIVTCSKCNSEFRLKT